MGNSATPQPTVKRMNRKNRSSNHFRLDQTGENAFTRWEFAAVLATLALSVGVVLPALAQSRSRSLQAVCANNLRLIGQAIGAAYSEKGASPVSWRTPGLGSSPLNNNSWY